MLQDLSLQSYTCHPLEGKCLISPPLHVWPTLDLQTNPMITIVSSNHNTMPQFKCVSFRKRSENKKEGGADR